MITTTGTMHVSKGYHWCLPYWIQVCKKQSSSIWQGLYNMTSTGYMWSSNKTLFQVAYYKQIGKREKDKLQLMLCHLWLSQAGNDLVNVQSITNEIWKLEKGESWLLLPANFVEQLKELMSKYNKIRKGQIAVENVRQFSQVILILLCMLDQAGMVCDIKINTKQSTVKCCTLITGQKEITNTIQRILSNKGTTEIFPVKPKTLSSLVYQICMIQQVPNGWTD